MATTENAKASGITAPEYYREISSGFPNPRNEVYFSRPLTSGKIKDLVMNGRPDIDDSQKLSLIAGVNNQIAEIAQKEIRGHFPGKKLTIPGFSSSLGFNEFSAIAYWMYYISGLSAGNAFKFHEDLRRRGAVNEEVFKDYRADNEERAGEYDKLLNAFTDFLGSNDSGNLISEAVLLPGHADSLGCTVEGKLFKRLGIPQREAVFNQDHPVFQETIVEGILKPLTAMSNGDWAGYEPSIPSCSAGKEEGLVILRDISRGNVFKQ